MPYSEYELNYIFDKTGGRCIHCRKKLGWSNYGIVGARGAWEVDHSKAVARGGTDYLRNLIPSCIPCNRAKGSQSSRQYNESIFLETIYKHPHRFPELFQRKKRRKAKATFGLEVADANKVLSMPSVIGAYVGSVRPKSAAALAGLKAGDIIFEVNGIPIIAAVDLETMLKSMKKGSVVSLVVQRGFIKLKFIAVV